MKITKNQLGQLVETYLLNEANYSVYSIEDVESAVDRACEILDIDDEGFSLFLKRISRVESGGNSKGLSNITGHTVNPFQLDIGTLDDIKTRSAMKSWRNFIDNKKSPKPANLNQKISEQNNESIRKSAKLSALFAALICLDKLRYRNPDERNNINIPTDLTKQSNLWKNRYNTSAGKGEVDHFISKNEDLLKEEDLDEKKKRKKKRKKKNKKNYSIYPYFYGGWGNDYDYSDSDGGDGGGE